MTSAVIITLCVLLLLAYIFDMSSSKTKIPSVILLLLLGWIVRQITDFFKITLPDLSPILPILGTVGLILIVLEGSLELEFNKSKYIIIQKSFIIALLPLLLLSFGLAYCLHYLGGVSFKIGLVNAIPFTVISSAIAIPSARNLKPSNREFITYESSLSDIYGVIFFNFITLNEFIDFQSVGHFLLNIVGIIVISFISTVALASLLSKIKHHVKFLPIILSIILIYAISKEFHLPALIFILLFGLFLGNLDEFKQIRFIENLKPEVLNKEVHKFKELTTEVTFLIRALFFLLFGYLIQTSELLNIDSLVWAGGITLSIFGLRAIHLKIMRLPLQPLLYIAPRGLISVLLYLSIPAQQMMPLVNKSLILQVIILTAFMMMLGFMQTQKNDSSINN